MSENPIRVTVFRWAGAWGPFKVNIPCGECSLTKDVIQDTIETELAGVPVVVDMRDWLTEWWKPLFKGGWHAPIVLVEGKIVSQGAALNRGVLTQAVIEAHARRTPSPGNHVFGKATCPHCVRAKGYLDEAGIDYAYHDVVKEPRALYEMLARVKPIVGPKTPVTVPQIWIDGKYVGGADDLQKITQLDVEPNTDRGQCSLSPGSMTKTAA
ncbi:MAG: glutaredoxin [Rhodospirillaceae bacterium]|nr:glutaredoxin [Rhodospirillaceae bacterium]MBT6084867.1 glutaredoxin [Rhodospirillaceae bacterium]MBT6608215.1 glutaredoxin [Rhodospirillaceae bacterium]MBT6883659.1 glutaredoxin [Rhodospirillaceae bacterium]MBT7249565.1 glutaredoxin [Rhodospirillaceae bacterium]